jgi:hypothetical protein
MSIAFRQFALHSGLFAALMLGAGAAPAVLVNPGFETGDLSGWTVTNVGGGSSGVGIDGSLIAGAQSPFPPASVNVRSGNYAAFGVVRTNPLEYLSLVQTFVASAGTYQAGFFMGNDSASLFGIDTAIGLDGLRILVDGVVVPFDVRWPGNNFPVGSAPADMHEFSGDFTIGAGSHTIEFRISGSGTSRAGISLDDFFLTASAPSVPEPASLALVALALLGLALARSRSYPARLAG